MALRHPWLGELIEAELDEVVVWRSKVKHEPGTPRIIAVGRLSDDGSNFRSSVLRSDLESQSELQIVRAYISKVGQCLVSDGQIQVRATLTSEAWSAYEAGLEAGQEPSQGDLICCQKLSVISTPFGPSDERIQLRIEQLEYVGKYRKTLGDPKPVNQRPKVQQLLEEITRIRAEQDDDHSVPLAGHAAAATNRTASGVAATGGDRPRISLTGADDQAARSQSHRSGSGSATGPAHPARSNLARSSQPLITNRESGSHFDTTLDQDSEDATSGNPLLNLLTKTTRLPTKPVQISASAGTASCQPASKRRKLSHDTALTPGTQNTFGTQAVNPRRRKPASLDHDGVGMADGVNNAGPIPPTSRRTDGGDVPQLPKAGSSHSSASPAHAEVDRMNVAIIDNAPTSAQIAPPDVVTSPRPRSRQQLTHPASNQPATARPDPTVESSSLGPRLTRLTRHKVPANQMALLEAKTCHVPPLPGQSLPHPNVPIAVLQAWNRHRQSSSGYAAPAQPGTTLQSVLPPSHSGPSSPTRTSEQEKEVHSSSSESDESEIIPWSQSPSQRALPLDSSAGAPVHRSQETPSQRPKLSIGSATVCGSQQPVTMRNGIFGVPGIQSPNRPAGRSGDNDSACTRIADKTHEASQIAMRPSPNKRSSTQVESGSTVTPPPAPKSGYGPEVRAGNASQASTCSVSQSLHDNGSQRSSRRPSNSESFRARDLGNAAPAGAPTGPRLSRVPRLQAHARMTGMTAFGSSQAVGRQSGSADAATAFASHPIVQGFSQVVPSTNYEAPARSPRNRAPPSILRASPRRTGFGVDLHSQVPERDSTSLSRPGNEAIDYGAQRRSPAGSSLSRSQRFPSGHSTPRGTSASQHSPPRLRLDDAVTVPDRRALRLLDEQLRSQSPGTINKSPQQAFRQVHPSRQTLVEQSPVRKAGRVTIGAVDRWQHSPSRPTLSRPASSHTGSSASAVSLGNSRPESQPLPRHNPIWVRVGHSHHRSSGADLANATSAQSLPADKMQDADHGQVGSSQRNRQRQGGHQLDDDDRRELHTGQDPRNDHTRGGDSYRPSYVPPQPSADTSRIPHPLPSKPTTQTPNSSEGLPMEAPKPLDYREAHQERRRDFFRGEQRKQWLREKISPETSIVQILPWLAKYRKCYPQDPVTAGQFAAVVSQLCPRIGAREHGVLPETTADDTEPPTVSPPTAMPKQSQHQAEALGDALQDITPALPGQLTNGQALSIVSSTKSKSRGSSSQRSSRRSLPWATLPEGTTSTANEIVHTAQPERPSPARQDDTASLPVLEAGQDVVMTGTANAEVTVFTEFARAWHAIKPGGAFARASKTPVRLRAAGGKLDVLSWGFGK